METSEVRKMHSSEAVSVGTTEDSRYISDFFLEHMLITPNAQVMFGSKKCSGNVCRALTF
jgi:hypothetical protein